MPQPIDINAELARTTVAQRVQEIADRASLAAQQRNAQHLQQEQVISESVVRQPPASEREAALSDKSERDEMKRKRARSKAVSNEALRADHGAGDLEIVPDTERHRLDVNA